MANDRRRPAARMSILAIAFALAFVAPLAGAAGNARPDSNQFIVKFRDGSAEHGNAARRQQRLDAIGRAAGLRIDQLRRMAVGADVVRTDRALDADAAKAFVLRLRADPRVQYAEVDVRVQPLSTPSDPGYASQWSLSEATAGINAPPAWDVSTGAGQVIAVLDTGITTHPDLTANLVPGYDFITNPVVANDGDGRDADPGDTGNGVASNECYSTSQARNSTWRGTAVAGTIAAVANNGVGVAGVAHGAKVQPIRVFGKCGGDMSDINDAIAWAAGAPVAGVADNPTPAKVIHLSMDYVYSPCLASTQASIDAAVARGATVVVAPGEYSGYLQLHGPATCANVMVVSALDRAGALAASSGYGPSVDIAAPGGASGDSILSTLNTGATAPDAAVYAGYTGNAAAAAHVSGVLALARTASGNSLGPALLMTLLQGTSRAIPGPCGECGAGLVDAAAAVVAAQTTLMTISDATAASEGNAGTTSLSFTVSLNAPLATDVTFDIATANGTATAGSDYMAMSAPAQVIPAGTTSKAFLVTVNGDTTYEPSETFTVELDNVVGDVTPVDSTGAGLILNDDTGVLTNGVKVTDAWGPVAGHKTYFTLEVPANAWDLHFATCCSTGDPDLYVKFGSPPDPDLGDYTCASTNQGPDEHCYLPTLGGTWHVAVDAFQPYGPVSVWGEYTLPPLISINDVTVVENSYGVRSMVFTVSLSKPSTRLTTFSISTANGTAVAPGDFSDKLLTGQTIPIGETSKTFVVSFNGDTEVEANETLFVNLTDVVNAEFGDAQGKGTILNDDGPTLSVGDVAVGEGDNGTLTLMNFTVRLSQAAAVPVTYDIVTGNGSALAPGDYSASSLGGETIPAGELSRTFTVIVQGDATKEANESLSATISAVTGASLFDERAVGTILNDDGPRLSIADVQMAEGNSGTRLMTFTVLLTPVMTQPVTYDISTGDGTAGCCMGENDYRHTAAYRQVFVPGMTRRVFEVPVYGDTVVEANEALTANLFNVVGATVFDGQANGVLLNDDGAVLTMQDAVVTEGNAGTAQATFTVKLSQALPAPVTYDIAAANGTAAGGSDYVPTALAGQSIAAGMLSKTFSVPVNGDSAVEANESFYANLSNVTGGATLLDSQGVATVLNDDGPVLTMQDAVVTEGNTGTTQATFTVKLSQAAAGPVSYRIATANGSAVSGTDYTARSLAGETIAAGMLSKTFSVPVIGDTAVEFNEAFYANLSVASGASILDSQGVAYVINDDGPTLSINDVTVLEGQSGTQTMLFTVGLSQAAAGTVTYNIATVAGTATAGSDFVASSLVGQTIPAGQLSRSFAVTINGDTVVEPSELFSVALTAVTGATVADGSGLGRINNDD